MRLCRHEACGPWRPRDRGEAGGGRVRAGGGRRQSKGGRRRGQGHLDVGGSLLLDQLNGAALLADHLPHVLVRHLEHLCHLERLCTCHACHLPYNVPPVRRAARPRLHYRLLTLCPGAYGIYTLSMPRGTGSVGDSAFACHGGACLSYLPALRSHCAHTVLRTHSATEAPECIHRGAWVHTQMRMRRRHMLCRHGSKNSSARR